LSDSFIYLQFVNVSITGVYKQHEFGYTEVICNGCVKIKNLCGFKKIKYELHNGRDETSHRFYC
jgi:hypothetical protein